MDLPFLPATADTTEYVGFTADSTATRDADFYVSLITPWQSTKARFVATVRATIQPHADAQAVTSSLPTAFDLDFAIGAQLDAVGARVGLTRVVPVPLANTFFTFGDPNLGFGSGYWKGPYDSSDGVSVLPDDLYRRLIRAKILSNTWDGTLDGMVAILRAYFTDFTTYIFVDDAALSVAPILYFSLGDLHRGFGTGMWKGPIVQGPPSLGYGARIGFAGRIPSQTDLSVLSAGILPLKAVGASLDTFVTTVDRTPLFGFGPENAFVAGFGHGAWGATPRAVQALTA